MITPTLIAILGLAASLSVGWIIDIRRRDHMIAYILVFAFVLIALLNYFAALETIQQLKPINRGGIYAPKR